MDEHAIRVVNRTGVTLHAPTVQQPSATQTRTLVIMLGWMGSSARFLRHYVNMYTEQGCYVMTFVASGWQMYVRVLRIIEMLALNYRFHLDSKQSISS